MPDAEYERLIDRIVTLTPTEKAGQSTYTNLVTGESRPLRKDEFDFGYPMHHRHNRRKKKGK